MLLCFVYLVMIFFRFIKLSDLCLHFSSWWCLISWICQWDRQVRHSQNINNVHIAETYFVTFGGWCSLGCLMQLTGFFPCRGFYEGIALFWIYSTKVVLPWFSKLIQINYDFCGATFGVGPMNVCKSMSFQTEWPDCFGLAYISVYCCREL